MAEQQESSLDTDLDGLLAGVVDRERRLQRRRVVVTGMGALTALGLTVDEFWQGLIAGRSGVARFTSFDPTGYPCTYGGEVKGFDPREYMDAREARRMARFTQFAVAGTKIALEDAGLDLSAEDPERLGVLLGNGSGSLPDIEAAAEVLRTRGGMRITPFFMPMQLANMAAGQVSLVFGLKGYTSTIVTACAAATQAIGEAAEIIRRGAAHVMVTGGAEAGLCQLGLAGFCVMRALSTNFNDAPEKGSRPFDAKRDGFVSSEGAGILILEELGHALARGARIYAEMIGYGCSSDAYHIVAPDPEGAGAIRVMRWALEDADIRPEEIDYINAHGTSTPLNDATETRAIKALFGEHAYRIPISSTKSMVGHLLGAAGGVEAIVAIKTIQEGIIHPTINYEEPDPECDLDYVPNKARRADVRTALSNSFGFGGQNACLVFRRYEE